MATISPRVDIAFKKMCVTLCLFWGAAIRLHISLSVSLW